MTLPSYLTTEKEMEISDKIIERATLAQFTRRLRLEFNKKGPLNRSTRQGRKNILTMRRIRAFTRRQNYETSASASEDFLKGVLYRKRPNLISLDKNGVEFSIIGRNLERELLNCEKQYKIPYWNVHLDKKTLYMSEIQSTQYQSKKSAFFKAFENINLKES